MNKTSWSIAAAAIFILMCAQSTEGKVLLAALLAGIGAAVVWLFVNTDKYFNSEEFLRAKRDRQQIVKEHNDIASYAHQLADEGDLSLAWSSSGQYAHLAGSENTSSWNYRRDRHVAQYGSRNVHNCSLQVVSNAKSDPVKYFTKYFLDGADELSLERMEALGSRMSRVQNTANNLVNRQRGIVEFVQPPSYVAKFFTKRFHKEMGVDVQPLPVSYTTYYFQYVSAGGNSSQKTDIALVPEFVDAVIDYLSSRIRFRQSAAGQRAMMTSRLREFIKQRDGYACKQCNVSVAQEPNLLLEVDHIVPVSRGGMTTEANLQTLCWRCNRSKSNKLLSDA